MARSIEKIIFGLKLRTERIQDTLTFKVGVKKYTLPFETRIIKSDDYLFIHVPPAAEIMKITKSGLEVITKASDAEDAVKSFKKSRKRKKRTTKVVAMPAEVESALSKIPAGYKLGYDLDGNLKMVKTRTRKKAAAKTVAPKTKKKSTAKKAAPKKTAKKRAVKRKTGAKKRK